MENKELKDFYNPTTIQEKKALYLEHTLEKMVEAKERIWNTIIRLAKQKKDTTALKVKHKSLVKGIKEVTDKANNAWKQVQKENEFESS